MAKPGPQRKEDYDEILLRFVLEPDPVMLASEISEPYDISRQTAANYLNDLEESGFLKSKQAGGRRMYWITHTGRERVYETFADEIFD